MRHKALSGLEGLTEILESWDDDEKCHNWYKCEELEGVSSRF